MPAVGVGLQRKVALSLGNLHSFQDSEADEELMIRSNLFQMKSL